MIKERMQNAPPSTPTFIHKLIMKNPDALKPLLARMSREWPSIVIPLVYNNEGMTPLKLAHVLKHRRVIGWLIDLLKNYPFSYCQFQASNMICDFISEGFENKVGEFLNSRFKEQDWTKNY